MNLQAINSMLLASAALPDGATPLPQNQPADPLTAVVSGEARSWHPGHALYCLWRWAQRRWPHTKHWVAMWRFHLDGRQHSETIPQHERTTETPATGNPCPVFAIHQIRVLALGGQLLPTIRTETEAQAAHTALVHQIFSVLGSALVQRLRNPPEPGPTASRNREHAPTNTQGGTIGTAAPHPTRHTHALCAATVHRQWKGTIPARGPSKI